MNVRRIMAASALVVVAVSAASCGGGTSRNRAANDRIHAEAGSSADNPAVLERRAADVCELYNVRDVNAFFQGDAKISHSDPTNCIRTAGDHQMTLSVWRDQSRRSYDTYLATRSDAKKLTGVGEGADYSADRRALQFLKGDVVVTVSVKGNDLDGKAIQSFLVAQAKYAATKV